MASRWPTSAAPHRLVTSISSDRHCKADASRKQVALALVWVGSRILLYLRDDKPGLSYPGHWALLGGQLEPGETPEDALDREVREEIGRKIREVAFLGRLDVEGNPLCEDHIIHVFEGVVDGPVDELQLTEGQRLGTFTRDDFRTLRFPEFLKTFLLGHAKGPFSPWDTSS